ncbi:hypothetical protein Sango_1083100 [Sesamum angolense]|uniref:Transposase MuDR plant domain-containing protein n=1 Tax=Sesamum angolense TaxID=2727404 RepID=A0AAE2BW96_9LAMI|nr:hypothetical protein Sango_1083100 [Sesamum angolense]
MVMKRPARHVHMPPPPYHPKSESITLCLHYGGEARHVPEALYEGGSLCKFDYVLPNEGDAVSEGEAVSEGDGQGKDILVDSDYEIEIDGEGPGGTVSLVSSGGESSDEEEDDVVENDGDLDEHRDSDGGEGDGHSHPVFNPTEIYDPIFELGMLFTNKSEFKKALQSHAIKSKRTLKFIKNDKQRVYVKCGAIDCEWKMHAIKVRGEETFQINLLCNHHSCPQIFVVKNVKTNWIKDKYLQKFKSDPKRCVKGFRLDIINDLRVNVSRHQAYRAKKAALKEIEGSLSGSMLDYGLCR